MGTQSQKEHHHDLRGCAVSVPSSKDGTGEGFGNVPAACRIMGVHPSTYYRWRKAKERYGLEILRPRERRRPAGAGRTSRARAAATAGGAARRTGADGLLPERSPRRDEGRGVAVYGDRHRQCLGLVGGAARHTSQSVVPLHVAAGSPRGRDLKRFGWKLKAVLTDNDSEFKAAEFCDTVEPVAGLEDAHPRK